MISVHSVEKNNQGDLQSELSCGIHTLDVQQFVYTTNTTMCALISTEKAFIVYSRAMLSYRGTTIHTSVSYCYFNIAWASSVCMQYTRE